MTGAFAFADAICRGNARRIRLIFADEGAYKDARSAAVARSREAD